MIWVSLRNLVIWPCWGVYTPPKYYILTVVDSCCRRTLPANSLAAGQHLWVSATIDQKVLILSTTNFGKQTCHLTVTRLVAYIPVADIFACNTHYSLDCWNHIHLHTPNEIHYSLSQFTTRIYYCLLWIGYDPLNHTQLPKGQPSYIYWLYIRTREVSSCRSPRHFLKHSHNKL